MTSRAMTTTIRRSRNTHESRDPSGGLRLLDEETDRLRLAWLATTITLGPEDGGLPFAIVRDEGPPSLHGSAPSVFKAGQRFSIEVGAGAKALGFEENRKSWFVTLHQATDAALAFAEQCRQVKDARERLARATLEARSLLFPPESVEEVAASEPEAPASPTAEPSDPQ